MSRKLDEEFIINLSTKKHEPKWMLDFRLQAFKEFEKLEQPRFGPVINVKFDEILYYKDYEGVMADSWENVDNNIRDTFCKLGVIDAEEKYLDGVTNQFESEVVYHSNKTKEGVIFTSTDDALQKYPDLFKKYFNNLVKYNENKYTALKYSVLTLNTIF